MIFFLLFSSSGQEFVSVSDNTAFVLSDFIGTAFDTLNSAECTIFGPTAIKEMVSAFPGLTISMNPRPQFSTSMRGIAVSFNGFRAKECKKDLKRFFFWIHSMGGKIIPDVTSQAKSTTTYLVRRDLKVTTRVVLTIFFQVSRHCRGEQYKYATTFDIPVMQEAWLQASWEKRNQVGFEAGKEEFVSHFKVKPFHGARIYFMGFTDDEKAHMVSELRRNGGRECESYKDDPKCTHIVVDSGNITAMPSEVRKDLHVVKVEWFWASIQMEVCVDEQMHLFSDNLSTFLSPRNNLFSPNTPGSHGRRKKRRTEAVRQLAQSDNGQILPTTSKKARSSLSEIAVLSTSGAGSFSDTPDKNKVDSTPHLTPSSPTAATPAAAAASPKAERTSARRQVFMELVQTEENYVRILETIIKVKVVV